MGVSEAGPEPSILSRTAWSLLVLHSWSAGARAVCALGVDRGTALGSSVLGQHGQPCLPAICYRLNTEDTTPRHSQLQRSQILGT
ncbi:hypothetical protein F7725_013139 [Dissostichus mawsoni]|uniref:Secreted protein n=1 Tax=Dissostichus mawsoni TaxID=36200 RepID=A0A7J5YSI0_DISMA|nr:hypothetical protein F7725_013139 [Dissostichus mawsoni]